MFFFYAFETKSSLAEPVTLGRTCEYILVRVTTTVTVLMIYVCLKSLKEVK